GEDEEDEQHQADVDEGVHVDMAFVLMLPGRGQLQLDRDLFQLRVALDRYPGRVGRPADLVGGLPPALLPPLDHVLERQVVDRPRRPLVADAPGGGVGGDGRGGRAHGVSPLTPMYLAMILCRRAGLSSSAVSSRTTADFTSLSALMVTIVRPS